MIAGVNFMEPGLPGARPEVTDTTSTDVFVRYPTALVRSVISSGNCTKRDWLTDLSLIRPVAMLMERMRLTSRRVHDCSVPESGASMRESARARRTMPLRSANCSAQQRKALARRHVSYSAPCA
jgi:hypothetical protein